MKKLLIAGLSALLLVASFSPMVPTASAQMVVVGAPYLGPMSPWYWHNRAWYYDGIMYGYYGPGYEWAPYGSVNNVVVQQPAHYYNNPQWDSWANRHPEYGQHWQQQYHGGIRNPDYRPTANSAHPPWHDQKGVAGQEHRPGTDPHTPLAGPGQHQVAGPGNNQGHALAGPGAHGTGTPVAGPANSAPATGFHGNTMTPVARTPIAGPAHSMQAQQVMARQAQSGGRPGQPGQQPGAHPGGKCAPAPAKKSSSSSSSSSKKK